MIRNYLQLQVRMLHRQMRAFGLAPVYAYSLGVLLFLVFSYFLFEKSSVAPYVYGLLGLFILSPLSLKKRTDFLRICFHQKDYLRMRLMENLIATSPFIVYLLIEMAFLPAFLLLLMGVSLVLIPIPDSFSRVIPTPFGKQPFEFPVGFRRYLGLFLLLYFVAIMGFSVHNFSLVIFILIIIFAVSSSFYSWIEPKYYVWIYHFREKDFLLSKLRTAVQYSSILALPVLLAALVFFPDNWWISILAYLLGLVFLISILLAKYTVFPKQPGLPEALLLTAGLLFPPFLVWLIFHFFRKAKKNLKPLLS